MRKLLKFLFDFLKRRGPIKYRRTIIPANMEAKLFHMTSGRSNLFIKDGSGAQVHKLTSPKTGRVSYVKTFESTAYSDDTIVRKYSLRHPNIICHRFITNRSYLMPDAGQTLSEFLYKGNRIEAKHIDQIVSVFEYLSTLELVYYDLHNGNVCIKNGDIIFIDLEAIGTTTDTSLASQKQIDMRLSAMKNVDVTLKEAVEKCIDRSYWWRVHGFAVDLNKNLGV